jgi:hypothetical protein
VSVRIAVNPFGELAALGEDIKKSKMPALTRFIWT